MTAIELSASPQGVNQLMVEEIASLKQALNDNTHYKFKNLEKVLRVDQRCSMALTSSNMTLNGMMTTERKTTLSFPEYCQCG